MLFNKDNHGAAEIVAVLGLIDDRLPFDKWAPIIPLGLRDLKAIIGGRSTAVPDVANAWARMSVVLPQPRSSRMRTIFVPWLMRLLTHS